MGSGRLKIAVLLAFGVFSIACTRPHDELSKISIVLPSKMSSNKIGALSVTTDDKLGHVIVNITGDGISDPILFQWDACNDCPVPPPIPNFTLELPAGNNRMVQVLAVYENSVSSEMSFYYGDALNLSLTSPEVSITIPISQVGSGAALVSGQVSGRYLTSTVPDIGPTGRVDIKYKPAGKPSLIVDTSEIVNGWFSFFMLSGASFEYVVRATGEILWNGEVSLDSPFFNPSSNAGLDFGRRVKAYIPVHVYSNTKNGTTGYYQNDAEYRVWGYWGPGSSSKSVCTVGLNSSPQTQQLKQYVAAPSATAPVLSISRLSTVNSVIPTLAQLRDTTTVATSIAVEGGGSMSSTSSACASFSEASGDLFNRFLEVKMNQIDSGGHDGGPGFRGIFRINSSGSTVSIAADPRIISGSVLPGVPVVFDELRVYKRVGTEDFHFNQPDCQKIAAGFIGYVFSGAGAILGDGTFSINTDISAAESTSGISGVLCPVRAGIVAPTGIFLYPNSFSTAAALPDNFRVRLSWDRIGINQCHEMNIELTKPGFSNLFSDQPVTILATATNFTTPTDLLFFNPTDVSCATQIAAGSMPLVISSGQTAKTYHFKITGPEVATNSAIAFTSVTGSYFPTGITNLNPVIASGSPTPNKLEMTDRAASGFAYPSYINPSCYEFEAVALDSARYSGHMSGSPTTTVTDLAGGAWTGPSYVVQNSCTDSTTKSFGGGFDHTLYAVNFAWPPTVPFKTTLSVSVNTAFALGNITPLAHHLGIFPGTVSAPISTSTPNPVSTCLSIDLKAFDGTNALIGTTHDPILLPQIRALSTGARGTFYSDSICSNGLSGSNPAIIANGAAMTTIFWKINTNGLFTHTISVDGNLFFENQNSAVFTFQSN